MNPKVKGELSEGLVIAYLLKLGCSVSLPFGDSQRYDLIVDDGIRLYRAQVKTGYLRKGCVVFSCTSRHALTKQRTPYQGQIEGFLVYCPSTDKVYWIPIEAATATEMWLRIDAPANRGLQGSINWAKDFELVGQSGFEPLPHAL